MITPEERHASEILDALEMRRTPIDVFEIARRENIKLCPTKSGSDFCGRLEFVPSLERFLLYYPDLPDAENNPRVRFSVGHELGHFYIESHRERLMAGQSHSSSTGFVCDKQMEMQADAFSAGMIIPERTLKNKMSLRKDGILTLKELLRLAEECRASRESAAIRYSKYAEENCIVVVSREQKVLYASPSDEAVHTKFLLKRGAQIPSNSAALRAGIGEISENEIDASAWVPWARVQRLSEESIALGYGGLTLTLLAYADS